MGNSIACVGLASPVGLQRVIGAFQDSTPVAGSTHNFYKYPARFSPQFAAAVIQQFSSPGDIVLDPFMGGGTSIVEATRLGRRAIGSDVNALSVFLARVKTTQLTRRQIEFLVFWADGIVPSLRFHDQLDVANREIDNTRMKNLHLPQARSVTKLTSLALLTVADLPDSATRRFARCALLNSGQWALDGRRVAVSADSFRQRVQQSIHNMLQGLTEYSQSLVTERSVRPLLSRVAAEDIHTSAAFASRRKANLVITSPPYPGIHILYHRWQVNGRRETPAPYWITDTRDGRGSAYYNLGDRRNREADDYFERLALSFDSVRKVMRTNGTLVQIVAFAQPSRDLPRYLATLEGCGFVDISPIILNNQTGARVWRTVPRRAWHATMKGVTEASREVLLIHRAA